MKTGAKQHFGNYLRRRMHSRLDTCEPPVQIRRQILEVARAWQRAALQPGDETPSSFGKENIK